MANLGAKAVDPESPLGGRLGEAGTPGTAAALAPARTATALISGLPPPARTLVAVATLVSVSTYTCTEHVALLTDALDAQGNVYVMIAIEHYSKHVELIPLPDKTSACTAQAFLQNVLARFSAPAEVVTDQGTEFLGEFDELLQQCFIDHRKTSANHPQADGAAERMVQLVKRGLRKYCESRQAPNCWDLDLPWLALGYRCSPQASTLHSPYQLLYGVEPVVPPGMRERLRAPLDDQDAEGTWALLRARGDELRRCLPAAAGNLAIAQHHDRRRYATLRSGSYVPRVERFEPGDYVYVLQRNRVSTLQLPTLEHVLRVVSVTPEGVATLVGRCGTTSKESVSNLAFCHLSNIDPIIDPHIAIPAADLACEHCGFPNHEDKMLLCDGCGTGWHLYCLQPALSTVPTGTWVCPGCTTTGITAAQIEAREVRERVPRRGARFLTAPQRRRQEECQQLDGRTIERCFPDPLTLVRWE
ncbi:PHD and RING finger domain-containing protein 1 [Tetrabaena socialis]|uniref:PHD and RING finger domain-containing protein 1 n=1 Tax=Tetrabaena socialis TaxID=47790 RepID=A0A2J7ZLV3_9CHLO|nr:PHD and RING finger domain-containing protein 1 [Tetrabaena socialis]|eukprot:PNH01248.1 PHD and RING finger domain-containing protein 1 [Tetrabaena socialis]